MTFLTPGRLFVSFVVIAMAALAWLFFSPLPESASRPLDLGSAIGPLTARRISALDVDGPACRAALDRAGIAYRPPAPEVAPEACAIEEGVAWAAGGTRESRYAPAAPALACPLAAGLALWEWNVVQPAAIALLGSPVVRIDHFGSFACRRIYGRASGAWSQHAQARAIDIAGFHLDRVRDGACRVFGTTLSPDYNAAHRDHLHLDEANAGWSICR
jgi:hypothetical protein